VRVRCFCGRFMKFARHDPATYVSGGRYDYLCSRCGARASVWSAHGTDDAPVTGLIWSDDGNRKEDLYWPDDSWTWRPVSQRSS
jgi:hypothetical protein